MTDEFDIKAALEQDKKILEQVRKNQEELDSSFKSQGERLESIEKANADSASAFAELRETIKAVSREKIANSMCKNMEGKQELNEFYRKGLRGGKEDFSSTKAFNSTVDAQGGYFVMPELEAGIMDYARDMGAISGLASSVTIGTKEWEKLVRKTGMSANWADDNGATAESVTPTYGKVSIPVHVAGAKVPFGVETLADMEFDSVGEVNAEMTHGYGDLLSDAVINGNGIGKPRGILGYDIVANSSYEFGKIGFIKSGASGDFAATNPADKLIDFQHSLKRKYRPSAVFVMNDATLAKLRMMKDGSGQYYLWQADQTAGFAGRILGTRIEIDDYMPDMAANSYSIALADWSQAYKVVRRTGVSILRDPYSTDGQVEFRFRSRLGGGVVQFEAIKLMKFTA